MREIKFRIYFEDEEPFMSEPIGLEELLHEDWIEFENQEGTLSLPLKDFRFYYEKNKNYKIMQYTGLKDKNGKEIYEGDIVKAHYIKNGLVEIIASVAYSEDYAQYVIKDTKYVSDDYEPLCDYEDLEVIGNIYNNPELLEKG